MWTLQPRPCSREHLSVALAGIRPLVNHAVWQRPDPAQGAGDSARLCSTPWRETGSRADRAEIDSSHMGMGLEPDFYRVLEPRLAPWAKSRPARDML
jgi:hypothetical protein